MKVLYAIQGTGNGHLSRAREIIPILQRKCDLDLLISGIQADVSLPYDVKYRFHGMSFIFGKHGGVDFMETARRSDISQLLRDIRSLPVEDYDLIINDFEPVSAWAARKKKTPCVSLSHQCAVLSPHAPKPKYIMPAGWLLLKYYAPVDDKIGFHFDRFDPYVYTPVIRSEIRHATTSNEGHYTVYLPAYSDRKMINILKEVDVEWQVFSKHNKEMFTEGNVTIHPVDNEAFIRSLLSCEGILCGAGFEAPAEALFLKKKVLAIPMKSQYEQHCNAAGLRHIGVPVIALLSKKYIPAITDWVKNQNAVPVDYPDETEMIIDKLLSHYRT